MSHKVDCLHDEVTAFLHEGRTVDVIYLSFSKALGIVSLNVLEPEIGHYSRMG